jgi:hypothetical protein
MVLTLCLAIFIGVCIAIAMPLENEQPLCRDTVYYQPFLQTKTAGLSQLFSAQ